KSVGAEGAFKLISEAWSVLSDKNRKTAYDQNRNVNGLQNKASQPHMDHSVHNSANGFHSFSNTTTSNKRARKSNKSSGKSVVPPQTHTVNLNTFWTSCKQCRMQYEYLRIYLNHNLLCPNCHQAFLAVEIGIPGNAANSSVPWSAKQHQHNSNHNYQLKNGYSSGFGTSTYPGTGAMEFQNGGTFDSYNHQNFQWSSLTGSAGTATTADSPFQAAHLVHKKLEKKRRKHEKLQAAAQREESLRTDSHVCKNTVDGTGTYNSGHISSAYDWEQPMSKVGRPAKRRCNAKEVPKPVSIDVPDPDFYDFDKDRLERTFEGDQVWATYDSEDGMPRLYAMVQKVLSLNPFKIRMSFLNSKSNSELGPINWIASGFAKTCGDFRVSRYQISDTVNIFSHKVRWEKGPRGVIRIVPKKGDIWALYRNWSPDWNELTPDDVIYKYEMVEILDDFSDEDGVSVIPLVKVAGFKAVFHRHMDPLEAKRIAREEMFRFSHQVPSYLLTGEESHSALKGCLELDPAATPIELLQVITEVKEDVGMETNEQQSGN
ncbi:unnamed protein product, partial [Musa textilis]